MAVPFRNRRDAGQQLAAHLMKYRDLPEVVVLGLPRGGIPVAAEVAEALHAPLDAFLVRKLGVPGHEELAMGAIASGGLRVVNAETVRDLGIPERVIDAVEARERGELARRERLYRGTTAPPDVAGKVVILVDDGLATGSTMRAAALALREARPAWLVGAVPVASRTVCDAMRAVVDEMICAETPEPFYAVGLWYDDFGQTSDEEVRDDLARAERRIATSGRAAETAGARVAPSPTEPADVIAHAARPLRGDPRDYNALLERIGNAEIVLLGEASHGTHEFYRERAAITRRLIVERGFNAVAVEADWPDAYRVNRFVRGESDDLDARAALQDFARFPRWMWRNEVVLEFVQWLREHNDALPPGAPKTGFYGIDLYSLSRSMEAVIAYLDKVDPEAAARARARYGCFEQFGDEPQIYGQLTTLAGVEDCENEVVGQLLELQQRAHRVAAAGHDGSADEAFFAEQNARLARNAEGYYRAMFRGRNASWNLRDTHMADTIDALIDHLRQRDGVARIAVWAHNSHLGDARATEMGVIGEVNVGQLTRERHPTQTFGLGFTTYDGTVTAASDWDGPARRRRVMPGLPGSYEDLFHQASGVAESDLLLELRGQNRAIELLAEPRLERAIGVIYKPETERFSHYFHAILPRQFDAILHLDRTSALLPLDREAGFEAEDEMPETWPFGV
ncbi:MAG: erythromycin esterase family protein [Thermomicrobiales bacterium]|nr:erythromycin esterase family protein [Thermomicrobiales bacterium]